MNILIATPEQPSATGNWVTSKRFRKGLSALGHQVRLIGTPLEPHALEEETAKSTPDLVILLHAFRTGRPWLLATKPGPVPHIVVMTGTDVHQGLEDPQQAPVIEQVLEQAAAIVLQNPLTVEAVKGSRPDLATRLHYLAPGIELGTDPYRLREQHHLSPDAPLLLCPASLRPVKGVLELLSLCDPLAQLFPQLQLAFCGPNLDDEYGRHFFSALQQRPWASYLGVIPAEAMSAALREADVVLNNSVSEGLPNALIEAATLGRPILARDIPGNAAVVEIEVNGLLYRDQESFTRAASRLLSDAELRERLSRPRPDRYDTAQEAKGLEALCRQALGW